MKMSRDGSLFAASSRFPSPRSGNDKTEAAAAGGWVCDTVSLEAPWEELEE